MSIHPPRPRWTKREDGIIFAYIGSESLPRLARRLGRSENAVQRRAYGLGLKFRREAARSIGLGLSDVASALGVDPKSVWRWHRRGWIALQRAPARYTRRMAVSEADVCRFLSEIGALLPTVRPTDPLWRDIVNEARQILNARYISGRVLSGLLQYADHNRLLVWRRRRGFPAPALDVGERCGGYYYERAAVAEWLRAHPEHLTSAVRHELGMDTAERRAA